MQPPPLNQAGLPTEWAAIIDQEQQEIRDKGRWRSLLPISSATGPLLGSGDQQLLHFCSNDYLSLAGSDRLRDALQAAVSRWGGGSGASRLVSGSSEAHHRLEARLAAWGHSESALLFGSGWHANTGILQALGADMIVFSDELNHASIIDGIRLARCGKAIYRHKDIAHLAALLADAPQGLKVIATDTIFSMDGDSAPLAAICTLAEEYGALVYVDEAHAVGLMGATGSGQCEAQGVAHRVHIRMGTMGKALGLFGAFALIPGKLRDHLINRSRSFIFTTALPPALAEAALTSIQFVTENRAAIDSYLTRCRTLATELATVGYQVPPTESPIIPLITGDERTTMELATELRRRGLLLQGIRPPTVPAGTSRLRLTVQLGHSESQLQLLLGHLRELYR